MKLLTAYVTNTLYVRNNGGCSEDNIVFFPFILDIKFVGRTSRGHTGGRSQRIFHPLSLCDCCRCVPQLFSREGFSHSFPSSNVKSNFVYDLIVLHSLSIFFLFIYFLVRKTPFTGIELTSRRVIRLRGFPLSYRGDRHMEFLGCKHPIHTLR